VYRCESLLYSNTTIREQSRETIYNKSSNKFHPNDSEIILDDNVVKKVDKFRYQDSGTDITEDSGTDKDVSV
jgi:hypothetical protein